LESPRIPEKRSPTGNMEKDGDKRLEKEGKELERDQGVGQEQDSLEALRGCPMLLIGVTGIIR
jgi:ferredoxin